MNLDALLTASHARLHACTSVPEVFAGRGLTLGQLRALDLGLDEQGGGVIPLRDSEGHLLGLKVRLLHAAKHKYLELPEGNGNPLWFSPEMRTGIDDHSVGVLCVEGELNGMVSAVALEGQGWRVVGLGSAFGPVPWDELTSWRLPVVFSLDPGRAGEKSLREWQGRAAELALPVVRATPLLGELDACEYAGQYGLGALKGRWLQIFRAAGDAAPPE